MTSPTARSLAELRRLGATCQVVEHWNAFSRKRNDLFGVIDIVAVHPSRQGVLGIQATSAGNITARMKKSMEEPRLKVWLKAGNTFQVWGWGKRGPRGKLKKWTLDIRTIVLCGENLGFDTGAVGGEGG